MFFMDQKSAVYIERIPKNSGSFFNFLITIISLALVNLKYALGMIFSIVSIVNTTMFL